MCNLISDSDMNPCVTFETVCGSGGLIDSSSACGVFTECHCGRLGDHALLGAKYWAPSDDRVG